MSEFSGFILNIISDFPKSEPLVLFPAIIAIILGTFSYLGTIPQKIKTGNEISSCCRAAYLFYPFSTSQNLDVKSTVKMGDYKLRNWLDR